MVQTANPSKAERYQIHPAGEDFNFLINDVTVDTSKANTLIFKLVPEDYENGRCDISDWVWNDNSSFKLKMYISACELHPEGGFDTQEFIGKAITCNIIHNKSKDGTKTYANIVMESLKPYGSEMASPENPNDPFEDTPPPPTDDDAPPERTK